MGALADGAASRLTDERRGMTRRFATVMGYLLPGAILLFAVASYVASER